MSDLVSILIPTYNSEEFISRSLSSAINQTYHNCEIIIIDNCSQDGTLKIVNDISSNHSHIKVFKNLENIGPVRNWRDGALKSSGKFLKILFSDDYLEPQCVEKLYDGMVKSRSRLSYSSVWIGCNFENKRLAYDFKNNSILNHNEYLSRVLNNIAPVSPCAALFYRDDVIDSLGTDIKSLDNGAIDNGAGPDLNIFLRASLKGSVYYIKEPLVNFWAHKKSITIVDSGNNIKNYYVNCILNFLINTENYEYLNKYFVKCNLISILHGNVFNLTINYKLKSKKYLLTMLSMIKNRIIFKLWI